MSAKALAFYLDAPMQAWGSSSRYQQRETEAFPTKSGVIGMLAAALGIDKDSADELESIKDLGSLYFEVRRVITDRSGLVSRLSDFHTVGGGYDKKDPVLKYHITRKASGGLNSNAVITHRNYLTDAKFIVVIEGNAVLLEQCFKALRNPKWGIWFGRKNCLPAAPLMPVLGDCSKEVIKTVIQTLERDSRGRSLSNGQVEKEGEGSWYQNDQPISFQNRIHQSRPVKRI